MPRLAANLGFLFPDLPFLDRRARILGVPLIAGISFEIIKFAARHREQAWVRFLMAPGMALQRLTTREPDHSQLAVAIAALRSVLEVEAGDGGSAADLVGLEVVA